MRTNGNNSHEHKSDVAVIEGLKIPNTNNAIVGHSSTLYAVQWLFV